MALARQLMSLNYSNYDIVIVDNASTDGTSEELAKQYPRIKVLRNNENLGGTGGFNTGLDHALQAGIYKYVWLLDDDVSISPNALLELVCVLEGDSRIAIAGSAMFDSNRPDRMIEIGNFIDLRRGRFTGNCRYSDSSLCEEKVYFVDSVSACSMCVSVEAIMSVGIWDDYFFLYCDDVDWNIRFKRKGYLIAGVPRSIIWHMPWEFKPGFNTIYYANRNKLYLLNKHLDGWEKIIGVFYAQVGAVYFSLRMIIGKESFNSLLLLQSVIDFLQGESGKFSNIELLERLRALSPRKSYVTWLEMLTMILVINIYKGFRICNGRITGVITELFRSVFKQIPWKYRLSIIKRINDFCLERSQKI
jgi:GT2 family glycosyltransferase